MPAPTPVSAFVSAAALLLLAGCETVESTRTAPSPAALRAGGGQMPQRPAALAGAGGLLEAERMSPRLLYRGFSIARPTEKEWYLLLTDQTSSRAVLRRKVKSSTRTVHFAAALNLLDRAPQSPADFAKLVKPNFEADGTLQKPVYTPKLVEFQGQTAVEYELSATLAPGRDGKPRALRDRGLIFRHPASPVTTVQIVFSQRGNDGELDEKLEAEGKALIQGVEALPSLE